MTRTGRPTKSEATNSRIVWQTPLSSLGARPCAVCPSTVAPSARVFACPCVRSFVRSSPLSQLMSRSVTHAGRVLPSTHACHMPETSLSARHVCVMLMFGCLRKRATTRSVNESLSRRACGTMSSHSSSVSLTRAVFPSLPSASMSGSAAGRPSFSFTAAAFSPPLTLPSWRMGPSISTMSTEASVASMRTASAWPFSHRYGTVPRTWSA
mmetsp:Transcript_289/g.639  ORF Transcript_289/g.639 Transcript_289/m.639 type:complete len:210 (-) Transcript_289:215-844(-)